MSRWKKPLTTKEVKKILTALGFKYKNTEGSHEQWTKDDPFRKVTVDPPKSPFGHTLIAFMARQAGVTVREFYKKLEDE